MMTAVTCGASRQRKIAPTMMRLKVKAKNPTARISRRERFSARIIINAPAGTEPAQTRIITRHRLSRMDPKMDCGLGFAAPKSRRVQFGADPSVELENAVQL